MLNSWKNVTQRKDPSKDLKQSPTPQHNQIKHNLSKHSHNKTSLYIENVMDAVTTYIKTELMNAQHGAKHAENAAT